MTLIDQEAFLQKSRLDRYKKMTYPYLNLCANVDITAFLAFLKENNKPFSISFLYAISRSANEIPEFRRRLRGETIVEHDVISPVIDIIGNDGAKAPFRTKYIPDFFRFVEYTLAEIELQKDKGVPALDETADDLLFALEIPLVSFTSLFQPMDITQADSIPRISWGKPLKDGTTVKLPLNVQVHNGLADSLQLGIYFEKMEEIMAYPETYLMPLKDEKDNEDKAYDTRIIRYSSLNQRLRSRYPYEIF